MVERVWRQVLPELLLLVAAEVVVVFTLPVEAIRALEEPVVAAGLPGVWAMVMPQHLILVVVVVALLLILHLAVQVERVAAVLL
jgi:hypothetical protein